MASWQSSRGSYRQRTLSPSRKTHATPFQIPRDRIGRLEPEVLEESREVERGFARSGLCLPRSARRGHTRARARSTLARGSLRLGRIMSRSGRMHRSRLGHGRRPRSRTSARRPTSLALPAARFRHRHGRRERVELGYIGSRPRRGRRRRRGRGCGQVFGRWSMGRRGRYDFDAAGRRGRSGLEGLIGVMRHVIVHIVLIRSSDSDSGRRGRCARGRRARFWCFYRGRHGGMQHGVYEVEINNTGRYLAGAMTRDTGAAVRTVPFAIPTESRPHSHHNYHSTSQSSLLYACYRRLARDAI